MEHFPTTALDPRKQELLEARFLGARVSRQIYPYLCYIKLQIHYNNEKFLCVMDVVGWFTAIVVRYLVFRWRM